MFLNLAIHTNESTTVNSVVGSRTSWKDGITRNDEFVELPPFPCTKRLSINWVLLPPPSSLKLGGKTQDDLSTSLVRRAVITT